MDVISSGPLRATSVVWQPNAGGWALTVVCKATYRLEPIESPLAEEQEAPNEEDNFWNDDPARSLYAPSDLAPFKARADVLLVGHAFAPQGQPVRALVARLCVGEVDKSIEVWCDRAFGSDGRLLEGPRFPKMPLRYERAAGGPETSNPIGMRFDAPPDMYGSFAIPNLQPLGTHVGWRGDRFAPIGFGPIAPSWPGRAEKLYRSAAGFPHARWFEEPLPEGIDVAYFNAAPPDQQVGALRPNERLVLENLHRDHARLVTSLPGLRPRAVAARGGRQEEIELTCDTLWIDTDRAICSLVWRGRIGLRDPGEAGRILVSTEGQDGRAIAGAGPAPAEPRAGNAPPGHVGGGGVAHNRIAIYSAPIGDAAATLVPEPEEAARAREAPATPFHPAPPGGKAAVSSGAPPPPPARVDMPRPVAAPPMVGPVAAGQGGGLPAGISAAVLDLPASPGETITIVTRREEAPPVDALPFQRDGVSSLGAQVSPPAPPTAPIAKGGPTTQPMPAYAPYGPQDAPAPNAPPMPIPASPLPFAGAPAGVAAPAAAFTAGGVALGLSSPLGISEALRARDNAGVSLKPDSAPPRGPIEAPAMIGPLATPEMALRPASLPESPEPDAAPKPTAPKAPAPAAQEPQPGDFELERCAAVTASIARRKADKQTILEENDLTPERWESIERHWAEAIRKETASGKTGLLKRFDAAYVEQLEKERGAIQVSEYTRIAVASERGTVGEVLVELGLPKGALMRIERVWTQKVVKDAALGERVRDAVENARSEQ